MSASCVAASWSLRAKLKSLPSSKSFLLRSSDVQYPTIWSLIICQRYYNYNQYFLPFSTCLAHQLDHFSTNMLLKCLIWLYCKLCVLPWKRGFDSHSCLLCIVVWLWCPDRWIYLIDWETARQQLSRSKPGTEKKEILTCCNIQQPDWLLWVFADSLCFAVADSLWCRWR